MQRLISVSEANNLIQDGKVLHIAGHERALSQLSCGAWVGGTTPYFLTDRGGMVERNKVYVNEIPTSQAMVKTLWVGVDELEDCLGFRPVNGFSVVIIPAQSPFHFAYALAANTASHLFDSAIVGWVSGAHLDDLGHQSPKVFDGFTGKSSDQDMIVMQVELPDNLSAKVGMINLFEPGFPRPHAGSMARPIISMIMLCAKPLIKNYRLCLSAPIRRRFRIRNSTCGKMSVSKVLMPRPEALNFTLPSKKASSIARQSLYKTTANPSSPPRVR